MREIEFKAKRVDNGEWVFGYFFKSWDNCYILHGTVNGVPVMVEVIPETVCQWTGLLDKHGVKIFEGDIFQYRKHKWYLLDDFIGVVKFKDGCFGYEGNRNRPFTPFSEFDELQKDFLDHIEVIGNIHDKARQKQALIDMMRGDEEIGLYDDNPKNH